MCKSFGSSLAGPALQWYTNLPNGSIDSFAQLTDTFMEQFASSKKLEKLSADLYRVYQKRGEPLKEYVSKFNKEKISIPACNPETVVDTFRKGLLPNGELYKELTKLGCTTMEDALARVVIQIRWEEDEINRVIHARDDSRWNDRKPDARPTETRYQPPACHLKKVRKPYDCQPQYDYCIALRLEVAALLKRGHLRDLLTDKGKHTISQKSNKETSPPPREPTPKGFCSLISVGSEISGGIQFEDDEPITQAAPHHDALVVSLQIANILVKRMFVDEGSSANILFLASVKAMGLEEENINRRPTPLFGFSFEQKYTIEEIVLPIYASGVNRQTVFLVIDAPSPYNVLLGRPWIHDMRAVLSTFHQTIRFPTKWGVREIKGDPKASRDCYKNAFKGKDNAL
ncbi:uncharacterized protein LOC116111885 [Pistacia vera]|uniref:uncharacterized protein LOC116111885 n=1 Tax=Pistacia vera TaxID=55513 RepID=UPI001263C41F|nr:uncharacterized protein LOC116111885 [Pistacia vera]